MGNCLEFPSHVGAFASIWEFIHSLDDKSKALGIQTLSISPNGIEKSEDFENIIMFLDGTNTVLRDIAAKSLTKTTYTEFKEEALHSNSKELKRRPSEQLIKSAYYFLQIL